MTVRRFLAAKQRVQAPARASKHRSLASRVALVTGSTRGIGAGIARAFAEHGVKVVVHGLPRHAAEGKRLVAAIRAAGGEARLVTGDLAREAFCRRLVAATLKHFGRLDILVNNAGIFPRGDILNTSVELWDRIFAVNLRAPFILAQEAVKHMKRRRSGCIINIGSVNAYIGLRRLVAYAASKGGLMTFSRNLANSLTRYRIRVNLINPGWVFTEGEDHMESVEEGRGKNWTKAVLKTRPFGRMLAPADVARAALFFARNELVSGAVLDYEQMPIGTLPEP